MSNRILKNLLILAAVFSIATPAAENPDAPVRSWWTPSFAFGIEPGLNSMVSLAGAYLSWYPSENFALDAGMGFGMANSKYGLRARMFFLDHWKMHPYVGISFSHATGWEDDTLSMGLDVTRNGETRRYDFDMTVGASDFIGLQGGLEFRFGHFILRPGLGWSQQLGGRNWHVVGGEGPVGEDKKAVDLLHGSGPILCVGVGFGF